MTPKTGNFSPRTDLANETHELICKVHGNKNDGILFESQKKSGIKVDYMTVINSHGEKISGKPKGKYVTVSIGKVWHSNKQTFEKICDVVAREIKNLIPDKGYCLLAALGNRGIVADATGPLCAQNFIVTRHIKKHNPRLFEDLGLRETSCIIPDVSGNTGLEAAETIKGIVKNTNPDFVIVIDSLASRRLSRLATTIQICDSGICPGSGIANTRAAISKDSLGVDVIALGIPTVVDAATLAHDVFEESVKQNISEYDFEKISNHLITGFGGSFYVAPKETDHIIKDTSKLLAYAINKALNPSLDYDEMAEFLM